MHFSLGRLLTTVTSQLIIENLTMHLAIRWTRCGCWTRALDDFTQIKAHFESTVVTRILCVNDRKQNKNPESLRNIFVGKGTKYVLIK